MKVGGVMSSRSAIGGAGSRKDEWRKGKGGREGAAVELDELRMRTRGLPAWRLLSGRERVVENLRNVGIESLSESSCRAVPEEDGGEARRFFVLLLRPLASRPIIRQN